MLNNGINTILAILFFANVLLCIWNVVDKNERISMCILYLSSGAVAAPLLAANPIGARCFYISYIFQEYSSFPWLTVEQNIRFGLEIKKTPKAEADANVEEMLDIVGLTKFRNYYPSQLSISMLQRVAIARAFATKPELLLMDEPYGQLDIDLRFKLEDELIKLWKKTGTTVLFITHNIEEAVYLSQKIMVLTNKPTSVKTVLDNPLPLPRDVVSPEFVELRNKVTDLIKWW